MLPSRRNVFQGFVLVVALVLSLRVAQALPAKDESHLLTLDEAISRALDGSPTVQEIEASFQARTADAFDARTLPNPQLEAELGAPASSSRPRGDNEINVGIVQPFRISHGGLRNRLAQLMQRAGAREKERAVFELVVRVRLAFARAWVLGERTKLLQSLHPQAQALARSIQGGVKEGAYGQGDEALFRAEAFRLQASLKGLAAETLSAEAELSKLSGFPVAGASLAAPPLPPLPETGRLEERLERGEIRSQQRAKLLLDLARAENEVARADAFPELRPRLGYSHTNEGVDLIGVGISFDLPFASQNTAERLKKQSALRAAEAVWSVAAGDAYKKAVLNAVKSSSLRQEEIALYQAKILPSLRQALEAAEKQVKNAEGSIAQLWQTLREYSESHERYLELWTRAYSERLELSLLLEEEN